MSIQSSVNAALGSLAVFGRMRSVESRQKAMLELEKQKVAAASQRADVQAKREKRLSEVSPIKAQADLLKQQAELKKVRNEGYALGTERLKIKQGGLTNEQK